MAPPNDYMSYMGVVHSDVEEDPRRQAFQLKMVELASSIVNNLPMDAVADQMAKGLCKQRLPPPPLVCPATTRVPLPFLLHVCFIPLIQPTIAPSAIRRQVQPT